MSEEQEDFVFPEPIEVDFPYGGKRIFRTTSELENWVFEVKVFLETLEENRKCTPFVDNVVNSRVRKPNHYDIILGHISLILSNKPNPNYYSKIKNLMNDYVSNIKVSPSSAEGEQVMQLFDKRQPEAAWIKYIGLHASHHVSNIKNIDGFLKGWLYLATGGQEIEVKSSEVSMSDIQTRWEEESVKHSEKMTQALDNRSKELADLLKRSNENLEATREEHNQLIVKHLEEMTRIKKDYEDLISLQEAESYWGKREKGLRYRSYAYRICWVFSVVAIVVTVFIFISIGMSNVSELKKLVDVFHNSYLTILYGVSPIILIFWLLRELNLSAKTNEALAHDAKERVVMLTTYLAMERKGDMKEEERAIILNALFRPASQGGSSDSSIPAPVMDVILKRLGSTK